MKCCPGEKRANVSNMHTAKIRKKTVKTFQYIVKGAVCDKAD